MLRDQHSKLSPQYSCWSWVLFRQYYIYRQVAWKDGWYCLRPWATGNPQLYWKGFPCYQVMSASCLGYARVILSTAFNRSDLFSFSRKKQIFCLMCLVPSPNAPHPTSKGIHDSGSFGSSACRATGCKRPQPLGPVVTGCGGRRFGPVHLIILDGPSRTKETCLRYPRFKFSPRRQTFDS